MAVRNDPTGGLQVVVAMPETVTVHLVPACAFGDYEAASFAAAVCASVGAGFVVAGVSALAAHASGFDAALFLALGGLFAAFCGGALVQVTRKRRTILAGTRYIPFRAWDG